MCSSCIVIRLVGLWPYFADIENKTAFEPTAVHRSPDQTMLVCGDQAGTVKLYKYPCVSKESTVFKAQAHVKEVSKVRFTCDGKYVTLLIALKGFELLFIILGMLFLWVVRTGR